MSAIALKALQHSLLFSALLLLSPLSHSQSDIPSLGDSYVTSLGQEYYMGRAWGGIEVIGGAHKSVVPCNWKFPAENFAGDSYHVAWTHQSALRTGTIAARDGRAQ